MQPAESALTKKERYQALILPHSPHTGTRAATMAPQAAHVASTAACISRNVHNNFHSKLMLMHQIPRLTGSLRTHFKNTSDPTSCQPTLLFTSLFSPSHFLGVLVSGFSYLKTKVRLLPLANRNWGHVPIIPFCLHITAQCFNDPTSFCHLAGPAWTITDY